MGFAGELSTIGLAEVFQNVAFNRLTGTLTVKERDRKAHVHIEEGKIRLCSLGAERPFDYVAIAARAEAAPREVLEAAGRRRRRRPLKAALREFDGFDEAAFDHAVSAHVAEEVIHLFSWKYASFVFEEGRPDESVFDKEQMNCSISLDPLALAMEAARRLDEWEAISRHVVSEREIFLPSQNGASAEGFDEISQAVLAQFDGTRDLGAVVAALPYGKFPVFKAVAALLEGGWATRATAGHLRDLATRSQAGGEIHRAIAYLEAALEREAGDLDARRDLVRLYERAGRKADAAREHKRVAFALQELGDLDAAIEGYERAAELVPYDTDTLEKIVQIHESRADRADFMKAGRRLAEALSAQGLHEDALGVYRRLLEEDESNISLRESLATVYIKLHEPKKAAGELLGLAKRAFTRGEFDNALHYYRNVIAVDRGCDEAAQRIEQIESGRAGQRRRARRRRVLSGVFALLLGGALWQGAREWQAQEALYRASRAALSAFAQDPDEQALVESMNRYCRVARDFPWTTGEAAAEEAIFALLLDQLHRLRLAAESAGDPSLRERAREWIVEIERMPLPADSRALWRGSRDRLLESLRIASGA
jgi:tetratricopeptide (TPR) repeat protein